MKDTKQKIRTEIDKLRVRLDKLEAEENNSVFENDYKKITIEGDRLIIENKHIDTSDMFFARNNSLPLLIKAVEEIKRRFGLK